MYFKAKHIKPSNIIFYGLPSIVTQPTGATISLNSSHTFSIKVIGSPPLYYNWYKNDVLIPNETNKELVISNATLNDDANYFCRVTNDKFTIQSNTVKLNVLLKPSIATQPLSVNTNPSSTVCFDVSATGSAPFTYNWYRNNNIVSTFNSNRFCVFGANTQDVGNYYCIVSNEVGSITSNSVQLTLNSPIQITSTPTNFSLRVGQPLTTQITCTGTKPITAQWRKDGVNYKPVSISNTGTFQLITLNLQTSDSGTYDCVLTNVVGTVTSPSFIVYVS